MLNSITDGFFALDFNWRFAFVNQRAEEILAPLSKTRHNLAGKVLWEELPSLAGTPIEAHYRRAMAQRVAVNFESHYPPLDNWFAVRLFPARSGLSVFFQDITPRKKAEEALEQQREWFSVTLSSIGDAVITTDVHGNVTFLNPVAEKMTGWSREEAIGLPLERVFHIVHEITREPAAHPIAQALSEGIIVGLANHTALIARDGTETAIEDSAAPIRDAKGTIIGAVMVFHDETLRRRAAEALRESARLAGLRADISMALVSNEPLQVVLQRCCQALVQHLGGAFARIWMLNEEEDTLELQASAGLYTHLNGAHGRVKVGEFKIGRIAQSAQPFLSNDVPHEINISDLEWARREGMVAFAGYPMILEGRVLGVMAFFARHRLSETVLGELAPIAEGISQWVQRRRAESETVLQKRMFEGMTESVPEGILAVGHGGRLIHANQRFLEIWNFPPEVIALRSDEAALQWAAGQTADPAQFLARIRAIYESPNQPVREELVMKDGRVYDRYGSPLHGGNGHLGWVWAFRDITERKQHEAALKESNEELRYTIELNPEVPWTASADGRINSCSDRWLQLTGLTREEALGDGWARVPHPEDLPAMSKAWAHSVATGEPYDIEHRIRLENGAYRWMRSRAFVRRDESGRIMRWYGTTDDIHERKRAEELLRASESRFRSIISEATTGVILADATGRMTLVNQRWVQMIGYSESELLKMSVLEITDPASVPATRKAVQELAQGGPPIVLEKCYVRKDRSVFWASSSVNAVRGLDSELQGFVAVVLDISERRAAEESLRLAKEAAEAASQAKDNFLAALSHELRTPLNPVLMTASALSEDESLPAHIREQLGMIERNIAIEARLIDDLLDVTRIASGKLALRIEHCDAHSLLGLVVEMVHGDAREKQISIILDLTSRSSLMGDPARLQQVFWNLLRNAVKFTPHGGRIRVHSYDGSREEKGANKSRICIQVTDTGIGLDPAASERIFKPFEQALHGQEHRFGGLGLGLAIARAIVDLHDGLIRAESPGPGQGTTFTVELPGAPAGNRTISSRALAGASGRPPDAEPPMRLLVVEDHEATLQVLTRLLMRAGHQVVAVASLKAAREAASSHSFDAVISDLGLPDGTGIELMKDLREAYGLKGIVLSGYGTEDDLRISREAGILAHLIKPVDINDLRRALRVLSVACSTGQ